MEMTARDLARDLLEDFAHTRGPLMHEPAWAVMRAIALAMVAQILREARNPNLRVMAAGILQVHTGAAPSKRGASKREWAIVSALFADVARLAATPMEDLQKREALADLLAGEVEDDPMERYLKWFPAATIFAALLEGPTVALQLQAARWILSRSRAPAQKVGYGKRSDTSPSQGEVERSEGEGGCAEQARTFHPHPPCGHPLPERERGMGTELRSRPPP